MRPCRTLQGRKSGDQRRWARNKTLAEHLGTTTMTIWRWRRKPELDFPKPSVINGVEYNDLDEVDAWMKKKVVDRAEKEVA